VDLKLPGLIVPPLTPFTEDLQVDERALRAEIDYVVDECDAAMVVAAGVETQEYTYLSMDQRKRLIRSTVEFVAGRRPVAVGITHPSFRTAVELAHLAQDLGADAVQLLAPLRPFGGAPTQAELVAYFEAIARETALPIVLYLNPGPGADVSVPGTVELAKLDSVRFIKESSRDLSRVAQLVAKVDLAGHARYFTTVQMLLATLELGGSGATMPPPAAELSAKVIRAFVAGRHEEAARLQRQTALFPAGWMHRGLAPTLKAAMKILGRPVGDPYPPFGQFTAEERAELAQYLSKTDLIPKENR
jgi:4-hydroxy-tetrahydrodipicolinate synthase